MLVINKLTSRYAVGRFCKCSYGFVCNGTLLPFIYHHSITITNCWKLTNKLFDERFFNLSTLTRQQINKLSIDGQFLLIISQLKPDPARIILPHMTFFSFIDIDECLLLSRCSPNASCNNTHGSYRCTCKSGYTGNGTVCQGILLSQLCKTSYLDYKYVYAEQETYPFINEIGFILIFLLYISRVLKCPLCLL